MGEAFNTAWDLLKSIGTCDFCMDDDVTIAQLPEHLIDDGLSYMCDLCWLKMNDDRANKGLDITPFPFPNKYQLFGDALEGME